MMAVNTGDLITATIMNNYAEKDTSQTFTTGPMNFVPDRKSVV